MLSFNTYLAKKIGLNEAIVLEHLMNWPEEHIINSYEEWHKKFRFLSLSTVKRTFASLEKQGLLKHKITHIGNVYQLCFDKIDKICPGLSKTKHAKAKTFSWRMYTDLIKKQVLSRLKAD